MDLYDAYLDDGWVADAVPPTIYFPKRNLLAMIEVMVIGEDHGETGMSDGLTN